MPSWGQQIRLCPHQKQVIPTAFPTKPPRQIQPARKSSSKETCKQQGESQAGARSAVPAWGKGGGRF